MAAEVKVTFLGGLGDIGRNCAAIETDGRIVILDCGQLFPDEITPGVDSIIPDFRYLEDRWDDVEAVVLTHGHEDHIGALAYLMRHVECKVYGSSFTLGLVRHRLTEGGTMGKADLRTVSDGETHQIGPFSVEFLPVTHSVPGGLISLITTPQGVILHSSDFKLDPTPLDGRVTDLARIEAVSADTGIRLLLADSTNADRPGSTASETEIGPVIDKIFDEHPDQRIITACFASHVHRVAQIVASALAHDRVIATMGLSMKRNMQLARELGILKIPERSFIDISQVDDFEDGRVCVVSTGSQAEERAALAVAAAGNSRWIKLTDNDVIVLSSTPIPGNEAAIARMINNLTERGAEVLHSGKLGIHTSGHGKQDELIALHKATNPEWFVPVHGEHQHLTAHLDLAASLGLSDDNMLLARDGDQVTLGDRGLTIDYKVQPGAYFFRHGFDCSFDDRPIQDRRTLGNDGFVSLTVPVDFDYDEMVGEPRVVTRGWLPDEFSSELESDLIEEVSRAVLDAFAAGASEPKQVEKKIRRAAGRFVANRTRRRPMIVPVVLSV
jgi:ribonuclease J